MKNLSYTVDDCSFIDFEFEKIQDNSFLIDPLQCNQNIPFEVKRMYYMYDIPQLMSRGGHGHKRLQQVVIPLQGSFSLQIDDGCKSREVHLSIPTIGFHFIPGIWREVYDFTPGALCLVLASEVYEERDYIRNYEEFLEYRLPAISDLARL